MIHVYGFDEVALDAPVSPQHRPNLTRLAV